MLIATNEICMTQAGRNQSNQDLILCGFAKDQVLKYKWPFF